MIQLNYAYDIVDHKRYYTLLFIQDEQNIFSCSCISKYDYAIYMSLSAQDIRQYNIFIDDAMFRELHKEEVLHAVNSVNPTSDAELLEFMCILNNIYDSFMPFKKVLSRIYNLDCRTLNLMIYLFFMMHYHSNCGTVMNLIKQICKKHRIKYTQDYLIYLLNIVMSAVYDGTYIIVPRTLIESIHEEDVSDLYSISTTIVKHSKGIINVDIKSILKFYYYI